MRYASLLLFMTVMWLTRTDAQTRMNITKGLQLAPGAKYIPCTRASGEQVYKYIDSLFTAGSGISISGGVISAAGIDTLTSYAALRAYTGTSKAVYVQDHTYLFSGTTYTVRGGFFIRVSVGIENGASLLVGASGLKWRRIEVDLIRPEWFTGMADDSRIQAAVNLATNDQTIELESNKTYTMRSGIFLGDKQGLYFKGNGARLFRCPSTETTTTLTANYTGGYSFTVPAVPPSWKVGDILKMCTGVVNDSISQHTRITAISGNTVSIQFRFLTQSGTVKYATNASTTKVFEDIVFIYGKPSADDGVLGLAGSNKNTIFDDITFDGNRVNNRVGLGWSVNNTLGIHGIGCEVKKCRFFEIPNENIGGFGLDIHHNFFDGLNGSTFHISGHDGQMSNMLSNSFTNNVVRNVNCVSRDTSGHNEGAISLSWNGGSVVIDDNYFVNGHSRWLIGSITGDGIPNDRESIIVSNNRVYDFPAGLIGVDGSSKEFMFSSNILSNCGVSDFTSYVGKHWKFCGNLAINGTILTIPPSLGCSPEIPLMPSALANQQPYFDGSAWIADYLWRKTSQDLSYSYGNVGIGLSTYLLNPTQRLSVGKGLEVSDEEGGSAMTPSSNTMIGVGKYSSTPTNHAGSHIYTTVNGNQTGQGEAFGSLVVQPGTNGSNKSFIVLTGNGTPTAKLNVTSSGLLFPHLSGTGNKLGYLDSGGGLLRSALDISTVTTSNGSNTLIPIYTGASTLGYNTSFKYNNGLTVGHVSDPEATVDIASSMQVRFPAVSPNTSSGSINIGVFNARKSSAVAGAALGYTSAYDVVPGEGFGTTFLQARSDGLGSLVLLTGANGVTRMKISGTGELYVPEFATAGTKVLVANDIGRVTKSSFDPATAATAVGSLNQYAYFSGSASLISSTALTQSSGKVGIGNPTTFNQALQMKGMQGFEFQNNTPNANDFFTLGPTQALTSASSGSFIGPLTSYSGSIDRAMRTLVIQGASDGLGNGISFVTGSPGTERLNIGPTGFIQWGSGSLNSAQVWIGSSTNAGTARTITGDVTLSNTGDVQIAANAVTATELADNSVTTIKIANNAVTSAKIPDGAIGTTELADDAVTSAKIPDGAIGTTELAANSVTTAKIADAQVTLAKMADNSVISEKIVDGSISSVDIANGTIIAADLSSMGATTNQQLTWNGTTWAPATTKDTVFIALNVYNYTEAWQQSSGNINKGYPYRVPPNLAGYTIRSVTYSAGFPGGGSSLSQTIQLRRTTTGGVNTDINPVTFATGDVYQTSTTTTLQLNQADQLRANFYAGSFTAGTEPAGLTIIIMATR